MAYPTMDDDNNNDLDAELQKALELSKATFKKEEK